MILEIFFKFNLTHVLIAGIFSHFFDTRLTEKKDEKDEYLTLSFGLSVLITSSTAIRATVNNVMDSWLLRMPITPETSTATTTSFGLLAAVAT